MKKLRNYIKLIVLSICFIGKSLQSSDTSFLRVGFILPFYSDASSNDRKQAISQAVLDYYSGAKIALFELEELGLNSQIFTWDINLKNDSSLLEITKSREFQALDILIGPINQKPVNFISENLQKTDFLWVSPLQTLNLPKSIHALNFFSEDRYRIRGLIKDILFKYPKHELCLVSPREKNILSNLWNVELERMGVTYKSIQYHNNRISPRLPRNDDVILINAGTTNFSKLSQYKAISRKYNSFILGDLTWYKNKMSIDEVDEKRILYPQINRIQGLDSVTERFTGIFVDSSLAEPSKFAFIGYDQLKYLGLNYMALGPQFYHNFPSGEYSGLINTIQIINLENQKHENVGMRWKHLEYIDFKKVEDEDTIENKH